ncbi:MAG: OB-fold domain-containing protein [Chloroflexi bacterium]|nr:OB-fold domain-containing protein [Chloroflexota bacterium]MDA1145271.1 OB-fold domain-containing protein [Chloroflexota bacterium]
MSKRPMPKFFEPDTQAFWDATNDEQLVYQQCKACNEVVFTPRAHCTSCGSADLEQKTSKGDGTVYTYSVVRQNRNPAFADLGAYALAYIDLDEGFRMLSNVVGVANPQTDVKVGQRVKVKFEKQDEGEYLIPLFEPI